MACPILCSRELRSPTDGGCCFPTSRRCLRARTDAKGDEYNGFEMVNHVCPALICVAVLCLAVLQVDHHAHLRTAQAKFAVKTAIKVTKYDTRSDHREP